MLLLGTVPNLRFSAVTQRLASFMDLTSRLKGRIHKQCGTCLSNFALTATRPPQQQKWCFCTHQNSRAMQSQKHSVDGMLSSPEHNHVLPSWLTRSFSWPVRSDTSKLRLARPVLRSERVVSPCMMARYSTGSKLSCVGMTCNVFLFDHEA